MSSTPAIRIDKGIPIPPALVQTRYPFRSMEVGDSFFVPVQNWTKKAMCRHGLYNSAARVGIRITVRKVDGGMRVWRTQ